MNTQKSHMNLGPESGGDQITKVRITKNAQYIIVIVTAWGDVRLLVVFVFYFRLYGSFTMESLLATAFGRVIDVQRGQSDELTKAAGTIFGRTHEKKNTSILRLKMLLSK